ncbi:hypothetical protein [Weissella cibaria]|nr:hypothetical protein [Weissella cibaria]UJF02597.1 hypothetical protein L1O50_02230 [Weissella cibaria]
MAFTALSTSCCDTLLFAKTDFAAAIAVAVAESVDVVAAKDVKTPSSTTW